MPGIVGVVGGDRRRPPAVRLNRMVGTMLHRPWYTTAKAVAGAAGLAAVDWDDAPGMARHGGTVLALAGDAVDVAPAGGAARTPAAVAEALLDRYLTGGVGALAGLNGVYAILLWERDPGRLTVVNDRYGFQKLYWWRSPEGLELATEPKALASHPGFDRTVSELAVADLLTVGHLLDDRVLYDRVKLLPPASVAIWEGEKLVVQPYWDYDLPQAGAAGDAGDDAVDEFARLLRQAVARRAGPGIALPLTGGLDSRVLAGFLHEQAPGLEVVTATVGHEHANDVRFARLLAATLGYPHTFVPVGPTYIADHAAAGVVAQEGAASCSTFWILAANDVFEQAGTAAAWSGFLGGPLAGTNLPRRVTMTTPPDAALEALWRSKYALFCSDEELSRLLKPRVYAAVRGEAFASVQRSFIAAATDDAFNRCMYVEMRVKARRFTSGHRELLGLSCRPVEPFADNDLVDFVLGLPKQPMVDQRLYRRMIVRHLPAVAGVPYAKTGAPVDTSRVRYWSRRALRRSQAEIAARLPSDSELVHDHKAYVHYDEWVRAGSRRFIEDALRPEYLDDLFDVDAVRALVADHMEGRSDQYGKVCALATFALWRRAYG
jgi:Asparagine synthase/Glutamine amidotransferase domain